MATDKSLLLYGYFRSTAAWRVRLALTLKQIPFDAKYINLVKGEQVAPEYKELNPNGVVPTLIVDGKLVLTQSPAILEFIEEYFPDKGPKLLPDDVFQRQLVSCAHLCSDSHIFDFFSPQVRSIVDLVSCDIHPVQNLRVQVKIFGSDMAKREEYAQWVVNTGFQALEKILSTSAGK
ncbi:hypothetical protein HDU93_009793 [Gonapodya sp. JEL0774]|nr:hypothetical protein HDU93_009793 [Gonapodya sp. JEL0774]